MIDLNTTAGDTDAMPTVRVDNPESGGAGTWVDA